MLAGGDLVVEGTGRVLDGADQQVVQQLPVLERGLVQRLAATPAPDQVDEPVDPAEALGEPRAPLAGRVLVQQIDLATVPAPGRQAQLGAERVECLLAAVGPGDGRPRRRQFRGDQGAQATADPGNRDHPSLKRLAADQTHRRRDVRRPRGRPLRPPPPRARAECRPTRAR